MAHPTLKPKIEPQAARQAAPSRRASRSRLAGLVAFFSQALKHVQQTGAVMPSSPALARAMTRSLREHREPKRVLEVGAGTGAFTRAILKALQRGDELHIVEINPIFARHLERDLLAPFRARRPGIGVHLYCQPIETAEVSGNFDFIVCGLPFNNFPPPMVRSIFRRLLDLLDDGGELTYFEYAGVRMMKGSLAGPVVRRKLRQLDAMGKVLRRRHSGRRELVLGNVPPAVAVRLKR